MNKLTIIKNRSNGFTLIELVVVIIILAILAIVAAPQFLNFKTEAVIASLNSLEASLKSANSLVYSKSSIEGQEKQAAGSVEINGQTVITSFGYITPTADNIENVIEGSFETVTGFNTEITADWGVFELGGILALLFPKGYVVTDTCFFFYLMFPGSEEPTYSSNQTGC